MGHDHSSHETEGQSQRLGLGLESQFKTWSVPGGTLILNRGQFLPRDALLSAVYAVVVCLCVCLSVCHTPVLYQNG